VTSLIVVVVNSDFYLLLAGLHGYSRNSPQDMDNPWGPQMAPHRKSHGSTQISKETHEVHNIAKYRGVTWGRGFSELKRGNK